MAAPEKDAPDKTDRDRARLSLESSVVVEAGAGTGKTTLLTDRILFLVLAGDKPSRIEEIVALTFTEKAAGEIKARLSERLAQLSAVLSGGIHARLYLAVPTRRGPQKSFATISRRLAR